MILAVSGILLTPADRLSAARMKPGPKVSSAAQLKAYTGVASAALIDDNEAREAFMLWARKVRLFFGRTVDGISPEVQVTLCEATADYLYSSYTPTAVEYRRGSRPLLEKVVNEVTAGLSTDRDKILALMRFVRDLSPNPGRRDLFVGGTEEEVIKKRAWVCNEKARALIILWQVAGYSSRFVGHHIGGHATTEVYFEEKWAYLDVRGKYFLLPDGKFANTWEIWNKPALITSQKPEIYLEMAPGYNIDKTLMYFNPREVIGFNNYFVSDADKYDYSWEIDSDWAVKSGYDRVQADYLKVRAQVLGLEQQE
ncbi:MAG: transglutaminase domain-containing protein [Candidatus Glassbacteria bacterium]|nr:transglutaminase domain-containing protein [Candidatus Glassbacteria bacterium]